MTVGIEEFRRTLGLWASGVTVVTTADEESLHGMTVSSFASVSLDPPLISIGLEQTARCLEATRRAAVFAVSILSEAQRDVSNHFASKSPTDKLLGQDYTLGRNGCPLIGGALAHLECTVHAIHSAGDHSLVIGCVEKTSVFEHAPLLYHSGSYGSFNV